MSAAAKFYESPTFQYYEVFKDDIIAQFTAVAPSPHKDFYYLILTKTKVIWRWWRITPRNEAAKFSPGEASDTYTDFLQDDKMQKEIKRILGPKTLEFCLNVASGQLDFLPRMPPVILKRIAKMIKLEDLVNLECTCKRIAEVCNDEGIWKRMYLLHHSGQINDVVQELARIFGWKRVFFTSKLKLQMQIRRLRLEKARGDDETNSCLSTSLSTSIEDDLSERGSLTSAKAYQNGRSNPPY
nr:unnamed protein product [Spirometra erinaceieuropaei]